MLSPFSWNSTWTVPKYHLNFMWNSRFIFTWIFSYGLEQLSFLLLCIIYIYYNNCDFEGIRDHWTTMKHIKTHFIENKKKSCHVKFTLIEGGRSGYNFRNLRTKKCSTSTVKYLFNNIEQTKKLILRCTSFRQLIII